MLFFRHLHPAGIIKALLLLAALTGCPAALCQAELQPSFIRCTVLNAATGGGVALATITTTSGLSFQTQNGFLYVRVPPNGYDLIASAPGFRSNMATHILPGPGQTVTVTIRLAPASTKDGSLRGRITAAGSSHGIAGALVFTDLGAIAVTDDSGYFTTTCPSGTANITVVANGFASRIVKNVNIPALGLRSIAVQLYQSLEWLSGMVSGSVRDVCTGKPLASANISASNGKFVQTTNGTFQIAAPPGNTSFLASAEGYQCYLQTATLSLIPFGAVIDFRLVPLDRGIGTVQGTITDNLTGEPLAGAKIASDLADISFSDTAGNFTLKASPCAATLTVTRDGYQRYTAPVIIAAVATVQFDAGLKPLTSCIVSGTVTSFFTGQPLAGAQILSDSGESAVTDAAGLYSLSTPTCSAVITICADGFFKGRRMIASTGAAEYITLDFHLIPCLFCSCQAAP